VEVLASGVLFKRGKHPFYYFKGERKMNMWIKGAVSLIIALTLAASSQAAEWNFYGSARVKTFYGNVDNGSGDDATNFDMGLQGNARLGAKVKVSDELKGRFEYGAKNGAANLRQLYGEWNFGAGSLLVGQTYTPIYTVYSKSVYLEDGALEKYGATSASRKPMIRLSFGGLQIAAVEPEVDALGGGETEVMIPNLEASYTVSFDAATLKAVVGYNTYDVDSINVNSYVVGLGAKTTFGPAYLAGSFFLGQNLGTYGFKTATNADPVVSGAGLVDNDSFGCTIIAGYKLNDMLSFEAGYGYTESELDQSASKKDDASQYYLQAKITMAPGVYVYPEIGKLDHGQDNTGVEQGDTTYFGAKWQINF
jgi:OmpA-like transmembrane domain